MSITLAADATTVTLPPDLLWKDEFDWHPVDQSAERNLTGSLTVQVMSMIVGREITLQPEDDSSAAMTRQTLAQIKAWAAVPAKQMVLTINGVAFDVMFRHHDKPAVSASPWIHYAVMEDPDFYLVTLKFFTV